MHLELAHTVVGTVVDHIKPHRGDVDLFRDSDNLQTLCKPCHDAHKQAQEHSADGVLRGAGLDGRPIDLNHPWHATPVGACEISSRSPLKTGP